MPKDITHWIIAEETAKLLKESLIDNAAHKYPNLMKLGAVFPDIPYYLTGNSHFAEYANSTANQLHGKNGYDTYEILKKVALSISSCKSSEYSSFLFGLCCHISTDIAFHPFVFYFTGNYHSPDPLERTLAVQRHRHFETCLDIYYLRNTRKGKSYKAKKIIKGLECPPSEIFTLMAGAYNRPDLKRPLEMSLSKYVFAQKLFLNPVISLIFKIVGPLLSNKKKELAALFYKDSNKAFIEKFEGKFDYMNPVTGEHLFATLDELFADAVQASAILCSKVNSAIMDNGHCFFSEYGPSLNYGLNCKNGVNARYFNISSGF